MKDKLVEKSTHAGATTRLELEDEFGREYSIAVCPLCTGVYPDKLCPYCKRTVCEDCFANDVNVCKTCKDGDL